MSEESSNNRESQESYLVNKGGRPRKYGSPAEFDEQVDKYYQHCVATHEPITWTGLALYLGFYGRKEVDEYLDYDGFSHSVKRAKSMVEYAYEKRLASGGQPAGPIFALKNFGWRDNQQIEHTGANGGPILVSNEQKSILEKLTDNEF